MLYKTQQDKASNLKTLELKYIFECKTVIKMKFFILHAIS